MKQEAAQRISKSLSSRFVQLHAQFLRFSTVYSVSLSPAALKVGLSWAETAPEEQEGPSRPSYHSHFSGSEQPSLADFFSLPFPAGAEALHCKRPWSFPRCLGGGGLKKHPDSGHLCSSDAQKACTSISLLLCQNLANNFSLKNCPELGNLGWGRRGGELGAAWSLLMDY